MEPQVEMQLITTVGTLLGTVVTGIVAYFVARVYARLGRVEVKVDGQLTETAELEKAVAFGKGEDHQRDKQEIKEAAAAGIKQANGPSTKQGE
jgi:hypothetical protein